MHSRRVVQPTKEGKEVILYRTIKNQPAEFSEAVLGDADHSLDYQEM